MDLYLNCKKKKAQGSRFPGLIYIASLRASLINYLINLTICYHIIFFN
jgi:hypothetical protein